MRRGLPDVPQGAVVAANEYFEPAILVNGHRWIASDATGQRTPRGPWSGMRSGLPDVPQGVVRADAEYFQPSIRIARRRA
jgi:hypothetical protein